MSTTRRGRTVTVRVRCSRGHDASVGPDQVQIIHALGTVVGMLTRCPTCLVVDERTTSAQTIAVLHAFGVSGVVDARRSHESASVAPHDDRRETVSLRVMLDHPELWPLSTAHDDPPPAAKPVVEGSAPTV